MAAKPHQRSAFEAILDSFGETKLLLYLTGLSYLTAHNFDHGYFSFFGLPTRLISVELDNLVTTGLAIGASFFLVIFCLEPARFFFQRITDDAKLKNLIWFSLSAGAVAFMLGQLFNLGAFIWWFWGGVVVIAAALLMISKWWKPKPVDAGSIVEMDQGIQQKFHDFIGRRYAAVLWVSVLIILTAWGLGYSRASRQTTFYFLEKSAEAKIRDREVMTSGQGVIESPEALIAPCKGGYLLKRLDVDSNRWKKECVFISSDHFNRVSLQPSYVEGAKADNRMF